jgi:3-phenylpropionate/trans-cinnamate dioxygenase ferredoxin reductase subunit
MESNYDHLIVGGGIAAFTAAKGIREVDADARVGILSEEPSGPYDRTALSKSLWAGRAEEDVYFDLEELGVRLIGGRAAKIEPANRSVRTAGGESYQYRKLLLATGVRPRKLPFADGAIHYLRTIEEYHRIRSAADQGPSFLVIGGGFLGAELAAALTKVGNRVTMVFPEAGIGARMFPPGLAEHLNADFRERGVEVLPGRSVRTVETGPHGVEVTLSDDTVLRVDEVVAAVGSVPQTELASAAGIEVGDGVIVDEFLRTSVPEIFAAGDVASYPDRVLGRRRVEHEDQAMMSGYHAGRVMAGEATPYRHLPLFYSDLFDYGYEAVGVLSPDLLIHEQWEEPFRKGVVYYLDDASMVRGVLLWDTWGLIDRARGLLEQDSPANPGDLALA